MIMTRHSQITKKGFNPEAPLFTLKPGSADVKKGPLKVDEVVYSREKPKECLRRVGIM